MTKTSVCPSVRHTLSKRRKQAQSAKGRPNL